MPLLRADHPHTSQIYIEKIGVDARGSHPYFSLFQPRFVLDAKLPLANCLWVDQVNEFPWVRGDFLQKMYD